MKKNNITDYAVTESTRNYYRGAAQTTTHIQDTVIVRIGKLEQTYDLGTKDAYFVTLTCDAGTSEIFIFDADNLVNDFGFSQRNATHNSFDLFDDELMAVLAFGLEYFEKTMKDGLEYAATIHKHRDGKFFYTRVEEAGDEESIGMTVSNNLEHKIVGGVHTHPTRWCGGGNNFSNYDKEAHNSFFWHTNEHELIFKETHYNRHLTEKPSGYQTSYLITSKGSIKTMTFKEEEMDDYNYRDSAGRPTKKYEYNYIIETIIKSLKP